MFQKLTEFTNKVKKKSTSKMIEVQANLLANDSKLHSRAGRNFLAGCFAVSAAAAPALAADSDTTSEIATKIQTAVGSAYGAMKTVGVVVAAVGVALAAFYLFTGGDKGMEKAKKTLLYTVLGCGILFLAVPIVNFCSGLFSEASDGFDQLATGTTPP